MSVSRRLGSCAHQTETGDRFRVTGGMYIYLLRNRKTGKGYVGQTQRDDVAVRVDEHVKTAERYRERHQKTPLYRAIRKHGWEAFDVSVLEEVADLALLSDRESHWIQQLGTLVPNGYNVYPHTATRWIKNEKSSQLLAESNHRIRRSQSLPYKGVTRLGSRFGAVIQKGTTVLTKRSFATPEEAALYYDGLAVALYGESACLNFPDKRLSAAQAQDHLAAHRSSVAPTSKYLGVYWSVADDAWKCSIHIPRSDQKAAHTKAVRGKWATELEAAKQRDIAVVFFGADVSLNFPDRRAEYLAILAANPSLFAPKPPKTLRRWVQMRNGRFAGRFRPPGTRDMMDCGSFDTEDEAYEAVVKRRIELGFPC